MRVREGYLAVSCGEITSRRGRGWTAERKNRSSAGSKGKVYVCGGQANGAEKNKKHWKRLDSENRRQGRGGRDIHKQVSQEKQMSMWKGKGKFAGGTQKPKEGKERVPTGGGLREEISNAAWGKRETERICRKTGGIVV